MSRSRRTPNGIIGSDSKLKTINRLNRELSDSRRELQLGQQIRGQLQKICDTSKEVRDVTNQLLYQMDELTDRQIDDLHRKETEKKEELKQLEDRLKMLRGIETNECELNVKFLSYKKTADNGLLIGNRKHFVTNDVNIEDTDDDTEVDESDYEESDRPNRRMSNATESQTMDSWYSSDLEGELNDLSPKRTGRKRLIPERFESFPGGSKRRRRVNGRVVGILIVLVLAIIMTILFHYNYIVFERKSVDSVREIVANKWQTFVEYLPPVWSQVI